MTRDFRQDDCPVCAGPTRISLPRLEGFRAGMFYQVHQCQDCGCAFVSPLSSDHSVYRDIYRHAPLLPGYNRYHWYYGQIDREPDPLTFLERQEESYWFIARYLRDRRVPPGASILEIGSGLGYLTYALRQAGYDARGVELTADSVDRARTRFGPWYECGDALAMGDAVAAAEVIILTEVLEHLENPLDFLLQVRQLLKPGGVLLASTPDRGFARFRGHSWNTDLPPVHLWWFTRDAVRRLSERAGMSVSFWDFSEWHRANFSRALLRDEPEVLRAPVLDAAGEPVLPARYRPRHRRPLKALRGRLLYGYWRHRLDLTQSQVIGAVLRAS